MTSNTAIALAPMNTASIQASGSFAPDPPPVVVLEPGELLRGDLLASAATPASTTNAPTRSGPARRRLVRSSGSAENLAFAVTTSQSTPTPGPLEE